KILNKKNKYYLYRGEDVSKDQSYFLYNLTQTQLKHILFPNSNYIKNDIRKLAAQHKIPQAKIKDSQDVCFAPRKHHDKFLKKNIPKKYQQPGDIILDGEKVGEHKGLPFFTYGQRQGINLGGQGPYYVIGWNKKNNQLFISKDAQDKKIMSNSFTIKNVHWISEPPKSTQKYDCQIRYQAKPIKAKIQKNKITLSTKVRAISPGQSAVFYKGKQVLGGGIINKVN
ncbi:tRNA 2-thiouridine(34) synthase MnmA, partial [Patescibacteria group bacterium]|nr:tRNA 2-thiouridine(34) synthase MnmA [Patescibacteria group bacterium]